MKVNKTVKQVATATAMVAVGFAIWNTVAKRVQPLQQVSQIVRQGV